MNPVRNHARAYALKAPSGLAISNGVNVAVIVLTYNGRAYLSDLFTSLARTHYAQPWEVIIVDNASTDGTQAALARVRVSGCLPRIELCSGALGQSVRVILNNENLGFAAGNNIGIRKAIDDGAEYVFLLNQDTVVEPTWLTHLVEAAKKDETIGAVQARLMLWDKKNIVNSLGNEIHFLGFGYTGGYGATYNLSPITYHLQEITYASGAAVLYRVSALRDVGLFDESFFMYHEDLDLGWRLWRAGWKNVLAPQSVVYHKYEFSRSIKKYYFMERNRFLVLLENYSFLTLVLITPALFVMELGLFAKAVVSGWGIEKLRAYFYFLRPATWTTIVRERRTKHKIFRHPECELLRRFVGIIAFQNMQSFVLTYIANPIFNLYWYIVRSMIWW